MSQLRVAMAIAGKDFRIEGRSRTALSTAVLFAVLVQLIMVFARDPAVGTVGTLAASDLWITIALASLVAVNRGFLLEREHRALDGILLAPISRVALFWGKWLANLGFVLTVVVVALPLWILFFNVPITTGVAAVAALTVLSSVGLSAVGTVFSAIVSRTRYAELLLPVLMLPFMIPPTVFAAQATLHLLQERPFGEVSGYFLMLLLFDAAFLILATLLFPIAVEE